MRTPSQAGWASSPRRDQKRLPLCRAAAPPPALGEARQTALKKALCRGTPQAVGLSWANWCWKAVRAFLQQCFDLLLGRTACIDWLHRLGFVGRQPRKRLLKADAEKCTAFMAEYQGLRSEAKGTGAKIFFVDEAHFRTEVKLSQM